MKNKYRIVTAMCVVVLFAGFGASESYVCGAPESYISELKNLADPNENIEEETPIERAIEAGICDFGIINKNTGSVVLEETPVQAPIPVSAPQQSPGIGIVAVLVVLSAIYISQKKR